mmetsp:Transcript_51242/g.166124  ORF Transcript_51242/g.166124 Transcript_51242/m.166124 type:complete len:208 (-) Transcript_51242:2407-3030(-)
MVGGASAEAAAVRSGRRCGSAEDVHRQRLRRPRRRSSGARRHRGAPRGAGAVADLARAGGALEGGGLRVERRAAEARHSGGRSACRRVSAPLLRLAPGDARGAALRPALRLARGLGGRGGRRRGVRRQQRGFGGFGGPGAAAEGPQCSGGAAGGAVLGSRRGAVRSRGSRGVRRHRRRPAGSSAAGSSAPGRAALELVCSHHAASGC